MNTRQTQTGIALISVLWVIVLLTILASGLSSSVRSDTRLSQNLLSAAQAHHAAEGGVNIAILALLGGTGSSNWQADGSIREVMIGNAGVRVTMMSESGKIDLNLAPSDLLDGLLATTNLDDLDRQALVDAILDWRDADDMQRLFGAEDGDYQSAGRAYGAKDLPFDSVDELKLVLGMSNEIFQQVQSALTVHSRQAGVDLSAASRQVLLAVPGTTAEQVDQFLVLREEHRLNDLPPPPPPLTDKRYRVKNNRIFNIHAEARMPDGVLAHITATVELLRTRKTPYTILHWQRVGPELFNQEYSDS
ncbi:MAG: general secretion pathway protein GspK [Chromatiales bacterium]|nr:general secretion pathway protein GspK [Chromatiales bacterium]